MGALVSKVEKYLEVIAQKNKKLNIFLHVNENILNEAKALEEKKGAKGRLYGMVLSIKSNINVRGMITNCASKVLENYVAPYNATVIQRIKDADGLIIGMVNMDEFAAGASGENSAFGPTLNPVVPAFVPGGSSSGSAAAVVAGMCDVALGSDTGGSIRTPASHCGVIGMKPSYGAVSRYGLIDLSMSLDQIGPLGKTVEDVQKVFDVIAGVDARDPTTVSSVSSSLPQKLTIGVVQMKGVAPAIQKLIDGRIATLAKAQGWKTKRVTVKGIDLAVETYYPLVYSEFFSATRRFDGGRYGKKIEDAAGKEVLRRIYGGQAITQAEFAGKYYQKALGVKQMIADSFTSLFKEVDCILLPTCPGLPWKLGEGTKMPLEELYAYDALTIPANLGGICALSLPGGEVKGVPVGLQIWCAKGKDQQLLEIGKLCTL
jgi:aspartyl-tRNA(Asn)/glutamyl-tRNA(Gln) amidotransferase subunit A